MATTENLATRALRGNLTVDDVKTADKKRLTEDKHDGHTVLFWASIKCNTDIVELILNKGIDVNQLSKNNNSALGGAAQGQKWDTMEMLLKHGASVLVANTEDGLTELHWAAYMGAPPNILQALVNAGANCKVKSLNGRTPADLAIEGRHPDTAALLENPAALLKAASIPPVNNADVKELSLFLASLDVDPTTAASCALKLVQEGFVKKDIKLAKESDLVESGLRKVDVRKVLASFETTASSTEVAKPTIGTSTKPTWFFISYVKIEALSETGKVFDYASLKHPTLHVFRDTEEHFTLDHLKTEVAKSRNVIVFLTPTYWLRPYTLIELVHALKCDANIVSIVIRRPGLGVVDFGLINAALESEASLQKFIPAEVWQILNKNDVTVSDVRWALGKIVNVKAFTLDMDQPKLVQDAQLDVIFKGLLM